MKIVSATFNTRYIVFTDEEGNHTPFPRGNVLLNDIRQQALDLEAGVRPYYHWNQDAYVREFERHEHGHVTVVALREENFQLWVHKDFVESVVR